MYKNLHQECLSIRSRESETYGRVVDYRDVAVVDGVEFVVQPAGRQRALEEERKNVHAVVRGTLIDDQEWSPTSKTSVTYNPYQFETFVRRDDHSPIYEATRARVTPDGVEVPRGE